LILSAEIIAQIKNGRRSMVRLPIASRRAIYRPGHVYSVKPSQKAPEACRITVLSCEETLFENRPTWVIRFIKGDHSDNDRYLAARPGLPHGDYVESTTRALRGTGPEVSEATQTRYAADSEARQGRSLAEQRERLQMALRTIREQGGRNGELRSAEERIRNVRLGKW
jgi:hypothetical protein